MKLAIILCEFDRPKPDISQYQKCWPDVDIQVFGTQDVPPVEQFAGPRYGWRMNDFYKVRKMLDALCSGYDVAMCFDGDMRIVDFEAARTLPALAARFGLCLPINPRYTAQLDFAVGADVTGCIDQTTWYGPSVNCSPIAIAKNDHMVFGTAERYCLEMIQSPVRGPVAWWRAMNWTGFAGLLLPPQWCVCERHIGVGGEIILHEGHEAVKRHYAAMESR